MDSDTIQGRFQKDHWGQERWEGIVAVGDREDEPHQGISGEGGGRAGHAPQGTDCLVAEEGLWWQLGRGL